MRTLTRITGATVVAAALAACGGGGGDDGGGVASLGGGATTTTTVATGGGGGSGTDADFRDAMVDYAECMRDQGVDFPDPTTGDGGVIVVGPEPGEAPPTQAEMDEMEAADAACHDVLADVEGSLPQPSAEQQQEMQDQALAFAQCMRDQGIDFPDPRFGGGGEVTFGLGGGSDVDDEVRAAQEACTDQVGGPLPGGGPALRGGEG